MMFTYDLKFITNDDSLHLKNTEHKIRKYESKKKSEQSFDVGKRNYCELRAGKNCNLSKRRLRELENTIRDRNIILCEWTSDSLITIVLSSGCLIYISVNPQNLEIVQILFDKYCLGKISGQAVNVLFSQNNILFLCSDGTATLVSFGIKSSDKTPVRIAEREPHFQNVELSVSTKRGEHHICWCEGEWGLRALVWSTTHPEPAPWSPIGQDRANLHLYHIQGTKVNLLGYHQLDNETLLAEISQVPDNLVHIVEQTTYQTNGVCLEWQRYEIPGEGVGWAACGQLCCSESSSVVLSAPARTVSRAPCHSRLLVGCIDATLHVVHKHAGLLHTTRTGFIATSVQWAGELVVSAEERGRVQCYDRALSLLPHHSNCLHLGLHLSECAGVSMSMYWRPSAGGAGGTAALVTFTPGGGPLAMLRILHPTLILGWIRSGGGGGGGCERAVSLLRAMDWNCEGDRCLSALQVVVRSATRAALSPHTERLTQLALGSYLAPRVPLGPSAGRYAPAVNDLARKFFHHLLRRGRVEKAMSLGVDLRAWDLFSDVRWAVTGTGTDTGTGTGTHHRRQHDNLRLADEARLLALHHAHYPHQPPESSCSESCSGCSSRASSYTTSEDEPQTTPKTKAPPLPTVMPVPVNNTEPISTNSIRPNLHQYLERDLTIWNTTSHTPLVYNQNDHLNTKWRADPVLKVNNSCLKWSLAPARAHTHTHSVVDVIPRARDERLGMYKYADIFQRELSEHVDVGPTMPTVTNMSRYHDHDHDHDHHNQPAPHTTKPERTNQHKKPNCEKNVKFSDTVTINVVSEESGPCVSAGVLVPSTTGTTALDYVEV